MAKQSITRWARIAGTVFCAAGASLFPFRLDAQAVVRAPGYATPVAVRFPIPVEQVIAAAGQRISLAAAAVRLVAPMTASTEEPALSVTAIEPWGDRRARIRIGCVRHEQCLAFYAVAEWPDASGATRALAEAGVVRGAASAQAAAPLPAKSMRSVPNSGGPPSLPSTSAPTRSTPMAHTEVVAKSGAHATLLLEGARMHIKVPVICLESGEVGRTIRVTAADHKQTYTAEVVDATLLKGTL